MVGLCSTAEFTTNVCSEPSKRRQKLTADKFRIRVVMDVSFRLPVTDGTRRRADQALLLPYRRYFDTASSAFHHSATGMSPPAPKCEYAAAPSEL